MKRRLRNFVDKGCWISDDRVNAFVSCKTHGLAELGYHGNQPVSRNSRMIVGTDTPALSFSFRDEPGSEHPVTFDEVNWNPSSVDLENEQCEIEIVAESRSISCSMVGKCNGELIVRFASRTLNGNVQGKREWTGPFIEGDVLSFSCRDQIDLIKWLERSGPYAGDFLIPEPMRRMIYQRALRSGQATINDLKPEFRNASIPVYDAEISVRMGGSGFSLVKASGRFEFVAPVHIGMTAIFSIEFSDSPPGIFPRSSFVHDRDALHLNVTSSSSSHEKLREDAANAPNSDSPNSLRCEENPSLSLPGFPRIEEFFSTVPDLVRSSIIREYGMPRATPAAYYWIWSWDSIVTGREMLRWGDRRMVHRMIEFVNSHRDESGLIPGRWTRSLLPLDTPPRGAIEFLFSLLVYEYSIETNRHQPLIDAYPFLVAHLQEIARQSDTRGMFVSWGFYPDLPSRFGRSDRMAVAMEVASHYAFCRLMENIACLMRDSATENFAGGSARRIDRHFMEIFWDEGKGFFVDGVDLASGHINSSYPIFTLLFLQTPLGLSLIRKKSDAISGFLLKHHLGRVGTSMVPSWDRNRRSEDAAGSWYPHWDAYLVKLLRRTGQTAGIVQWLKNVEHALGKLGYCPEFVKLDPFDSGDPEAWSYHGSASNLNCVTGWYRALVEGVVGIEIDVGGITVIHTSLPFETIQLQGLVCRGSTWNIIAHPKGKWIREIVIDGEKVTGCLKIPSRFYDGKPHTMEIWSDDIIPPWIICEAVNAEVGDVLCADDSLSVSLRPLGTVDIVFASDHPVDVLVDGRIYDSIQHTHHEQKIIQVRSSGEFEVKLKKRLVV